MPPLPSRTTKCAFRFEMMNWLRIAEPIPCKSSSHPLYREREAFWMRASLGHFNPLAFSSFVFPLTKIHLSSRSVKPLLYPLCPHAHLSTSFFHRYLSSLAAPPSSSFNDFHPSHLRKTQTSITRICRPLTFTSPRVHRPLSTIAIYSIYATFKPQ